jgi:hypothetical protein
VSALGFAYLGTKDWRLLAVTGLFWMSRRSGLPGRSATSSSPTPRKRMCRHWPGRELSIVQPSLHDYSALVSDWLASPTHPALFWRLEYNPHACRPGI